MLTNTVNGSYLSFQWLAVLVCSEKESFAYHGPKTQEEMKLLQSSRGNQAARWTIDSSDQLIVPHWLVLSRAPAPRGGFLTCWPAAPGTSAPLRQPSGCRLALAEHCISKRGNSKGTFGPLFGSVPASKNRSKCRKEQRSGGLDSEARKEGGTMARADPGDWRGASEKL